MGNKNDKVVGDKNAGNKGKTEKESINLTKASHISSIGSFVLSIVNIFVGKIKISTFYSVLIIVWIIFFVMLIIKVIKKQMITSTFAKLNLAVSAIVIVISLYSMIWNGITFHPPDPTPVPNGTAVQTETIQPPTSTYTSTLTLTPTLTPTPTSTPTNYVINVCVFDLGLDENNEPIVKTNVDNLERLGFNVKIINIDEKSSYEGCEVLYLSDGWANIKNDLKIVQNMENLKKKLEEPNAPGLLIGNPGKDYTPFNIDFYAPINYCKISTERIEELFPPDIREENAIKYSFLSDFIPADNVKLDEEKRKELPVPESVASIEQDYDKPYSFQFLVVGNQLKDITVKKQCDNHTVIGGLIASNESQNNPRYIIMPGGEFSSRYPISDDLFVLIIKWLAGISIE